MSTAIALSNTQVPAHLAGRVGVPSMLAQSLTGGLSSSNIFPRISIKGSRFRIVEGDTETVLESTTLDVVVVGANPRLSKTWYAKAWSKDAEPSAPDCFSVDGVGPDTSATDPQNDLCASCPQNAWGSKVTDAGQQIKACSDKKRLAVVSTDDPSGAIYLLEVTPAALKGLNQYQKELSVRGIPPEIVVTRISFDTDASFPKLQFGFGGFLTSDVQEVVDGLFGTIEVKEITGENGGTRPVEVPKVAAKPALREVAPVVESAPAPAPAPAPSPVAALKRGFGASKEVASAPKAVPKQDTTTTQATSSLADEIAALVGEVSADDE